MAKIELKQPIVEEISANIQDAASVVVVDYRGITVAQDTALRKQLREAGVTYKVYKNTMMTRAFKGTAFEGLTSSLEGTNAIAISKTDATAPARIINNFAKDCPALEMKNCSPSSLEAFSLLLQTLLVCLIRSQKKAVQVHAKQLLQQRKLQQQKRLRQNNSIGI